MPTRNVNLTDRYDDFVAGEVTAGRYKNASEVVRAGLALLEQQREYEELKLKALRKAVRDGIASLDQAEGFRTSDERGLDEYLNAVGVRASRRAKS